LDIVFYAGSDGGGGVVWSISRPQAEADFRRMAPESNGEIILEYLCKRASPRMSK
jgi:hypothetical protein